MEMEHEAMPGPSKVREQITNLSTGKLGPAGGGCHPGDKIAQCATSQISARSDYGLTGHSDVRFDV